VELLIDLLDALRQIVRSAYLALLVLAALGATLAWGVRSRRISPFSGFGRFARRVTDPLLTPVDRMILRAGGSATLTPLWGFIFVLVIGALAVVLVTAARDAAFQLERAIGAGLMGMVWLAVSWAFGVLWLALLVRVLTSWLGGTESRLGRLSGSLTEWMLAPLRQVIPPMGGFDLSPLVAFFLLGLVRGVVLSAL
jgi:YggT family protein